MATRYDTGGGDSMRIQIKRVAIKFVEQRRVEA